MNYMNYMLGCKQSKALRHKLGCSGNYQKQNKKNSTGLVTSGMAVLIEGTEAKTELRD